MAELREHPCEFDIQVQLCVDLDEMPVEEPSELWSEEHRPLGNIMRARKEVYRQSSLLRHRLNGQERREPRSVAEIFGGLRERM